MGSPNFGAAKEFQLFCGFLLFSVAVLKYSLNLDGLLKMLYVKPLNFNEKIKYQSKYIKKTITKITMMKYLFFTFFCFSICFSQSPRRVMKKIRANPIIFIDSINVEPAEMQKFDPNIISLVTVFKSKEAVELYGEDGKDGVIFIETKPFSKNRYQNYFKTKSPAYKKIIEEELNTENVQYILNGKILTENYDGDLASITDKTFKKIQIINSQELEKKYKITGKTYGILITSDVPENLYKGKEKFK